MAEGSFQEYRLLVEETQTISARRQSLNISYLSMNATLVAGMVGASALLPQRGWLDTALLIVTLTIVLIVGWAICGDWINASGRYRRMLEDCIKALRLIETQPDSPVVYAMYVDNTAVSQQFTMGRAVERLPFIFLLIYPAGFVLFIACALAAQFGWLTM